MSPEELATRERLASEDPLVITATAEGFRVHAPGGPAHLVRGSPGAPECTCEAFQAHRLRPGWRCRHILAVIERAAPPDGVEEKQTDGGSQQAAEVNGPDPAADALGSGSTLRLKRSVSPDGRIDALSVELTVPIGEREGGEIALSAVQMLTLQDAITARFLGKKSEAPPAARPKAAPQPKGVLPAEILDVGGMDGRWGRRHYLRFRVNGQVLRRFGSLTELARCVADAGYAGVAENLAEGDTLGLPCYVTVRPSKDGRYMNVESVFARQVEA